MVKDGYASVPSSSPQKSSAHNALSNGKQRQVKINEEAYKSLDANKLLNEFGTYGRYQMISYVLCQFTNFFYAVSIFIMIFINRRPTDFICKIQDPLRMELINMADPCRLKDLEAGKELKCAAYGSGTSIVSNSTSKSRSILLEYQLLCSNPFIQEAGFWIFSVGALIAVPIASHLSDRYGRRPVLLIAMYLSTLFSFVTAFSPNYFVFVALRFLVGAAADTYLTVASILCCEVVAGSFREWISFFGVTSWLLGYLYVGVLELFIKDWRKLYFVSTIPNLLTLIYSWFDIINHFGLLPESPHWMVSNNRIYDVRDYVETSSKFNDMKIDLDKCRSHSSTKNMASEERTACSLFKRKRIMYFLFVNGFITMILNFYYFVVSLDSINLTKQEFMGYVLSGLSEIPGGIIAVPLLHFFGRRSVTCGSFFLQATSALIAPFLAEIVWARLLCHFIGRMVNEAAFASHPLLVNEMMPTTIRTISFSLINIPQCIGIMFSPILKYVDLSGGKISHFILAGLSFAATLLAITLPETKGKPMPEDLDEFDPGPFLKYFIVRRN